MKIPPHGHRDAGFSLVEMLTVIAVIGVMAAIAVPQLGNINTASTAAKNQRNAQSLVNTYHSGLAMGIIWTGNDRNSKIGAVIAGQTVTGGVFNGQTSKVQGMNGDSVTGLYPYVGIDANSDLLYDKSGSQSPN